MEVLQDWPVPNNRANLRTFLGCVGYLREYIREYEKIAEPLYRLERKWTFFKWNEDCQERTIGLSPVNGTFFPMPN